MNDLEAKYRNCELVGIAASAEIQAVARQVAEENRRLRALLVKHGIAVSEIDGDGSGAEKARELEGLVGRRKSCGGEGSRDPTPNLESCEKSLEEMRQQHGQMPERGRRWSREKLANLRPSPAAAGTSELGLATASATVVSPLAENPYTPDAVIAYAQAPSLETYDQYPDQSHVSGFAQDWPHPQNVEQWPQSTVRDPQHRSCRDLAEAIRYVRPTLSQQELEQQMGCQPGIDCKVPNYEAFDLMDRLSEDARR
ncbi:hypothetical protein CB0940_07000 [Cercospora beticola]|uniref:Uncharacterized protein n=1 Tax=Cercospora beticola TaxID=122368 RepID=A0A2G5H9Z4_CERBT|nr:hypothetical protein CB0940_07000 [Cercospora beticola]PIA89113.1 hypothetical protein CB0940_07000 [Cercospora beticola]WPB02920.1 hypothetical protein RHO25_007556 [Cercospora beticola]